MDIEIVINGESLAYSHSSDARLRATIASIQNRRVDLVIVVRLLSQGVNLVVSYPPSAVENDKSVKARPLRPHEKELLDTWDRCGLHAPDLIIDRFIEFLHQAKP